MIADTPENNFRQIMQCNADYFTGGGGCHCRASLTARCLCLRPGDWRGAAPRAATAGPSMNPGLVSHGHKHPSSSRSHTKLLHPQCKESDV